MSDTPVQVQFWDLNIGNVLVLIGIIIQGAILYARSNRQHGENQEKIAELTRWKNAHDLDAKQRDDAITQLKIISAAMEATAVAMQRSVEMMQRQLEELLRRDRTGRKHDGD